MHEKNNQKIPSAFIWRRLHSLMGLWLVVYLILHLAANSQAAMPVGDDGIGFIKAANDIRQLPYLRAIEILILAIPFAIHTYWGVIYLFQGTPNSTPTDGQTPSLPEYPRNQAYTWQRATSWILLFLIAIHVIQMRFMEGPVIAQKGAEKSYMMKVNNDAGLATLSDRLGATIYDQQQIASLKYSDHPTDTPANQQKQSQENGWVTALKSQAITENQRIVVTDNFGTAELFMVRETFKQPAMLVLYTVLVLSACFHAFNGVWTFMITWGVTLSQRSQRLMRHLTTFLMLTIAFLGLAAVWGTYWINLRY